MSLDFSPEMSGAEMRIIALFNDEVYSILKNNDFYIVILQAFLDFIQHYLGYPGDVLPIERVEYDHLINSIEKFWIEDSFQL